MVAQVSLLLFHGSIMTEEQIALIDAETYLYRSIMAKLQALINANDRLTSGELDNLIADFNFTQEQIDNWNAKIAADKQALIQSLLAIYQQYMGDGNVK